ncbi:MAG: sialate O-acetylesterase [Ruthenibacterium lactatiformans]
MRTNPGHSPWLHFAKRLKRAQGIPSALFMRLRRRAAALVEPGENGALFTNMLEMLADYDIHPRAVLWYQGEAEGYEDSAQTYLERFAAFVRHTRGAGPAGLPFLTVKLNRCMEGQVKSWTASGGMVRGRSAGRGTRWSM